MAVSTYSELQSAALSVVGREGDSSLSGYLPTAIAMVEAKMNRRLRVGQMEASAVGTSANGLLALPADFLGATRVEAYPHGPLEQVAPSLASRAYPEASEATCPRYYTIVGSTLTTFPAYTGDINLDYYQKIPALSDAEPTNWLLSEYPDVYLWLTVSELEAFSKNAEAALLWNQRGIAAVEEVEQRDNSKRFENLTIQTHDLTLCTRGY